MADYDDINIIKDETEFGYTVEVNDNSYFYNIETERDYDFDFLSYVFSAKKVRNKTKNLSSYFKTHFDVVQFITDCLGNNLEYDNFTNAVSIRQYQQGSGGMYELAKEWTDEFTEKYKEEVWRKTLEYYDTLEIFLTDKNNV